MIYRFLLALLVCSSVMCPRAFALQAKIKAGTATMPAARVSKSQQLKPKLGGEVHQKKVAVKKVHQRKVATKRSRSIVSAPLDSIRITSRFGPRIHPVLNTTDFHAGVDFAADLDDPVKSISDGVVTVAESREALGNTVYVSHPRLRVTSIYGHLDKIAVRRGQRVSVGQIIGFAGTTGRSTGVHLHLTLKNQRTRKLLDPVGYLANLGATGIREALVAQANSAAVTGRSPSRILTLAAVAAKPRSQKDRRIDTAQLMNSTKVRTPSDRVDGQPSPSPQRDAQLLEAMGKADELKQLFAEGCVSRNAVTEAESRVQALRAII